MIKSLLERLKKKWGPLPIGAWVGIASAAGWFLLKRGSAEATPTQTAAEPAFVGAGDVGDLAPLGSGPADSSQPVATPGEAFPDKGITSDFQDFMNQLFEQELSRRGEGEGTGANGETPSGPGRSVVEAVDPSTDKKHTVGGIAAKLGGRPRPKKTAKPKKKPKKRPPPRSGGRRSAGAASHGSGGAGARPRPTRSRPKPKPPRPRARPKPKAKAKPRPKRRPTRNRRYAGGRPG